MNNGRPPIKHTAAKGGGAKLSIEDTGVTLTRLARLRQEDPYQGAMTSKSTPRKKDLRKLGEWIKAKQVAERLKQPQTSPVPAATDTKKP